MEKMFHDFSGPTFGSLGGLATTERRAESTQLAKGVRFGTCTFVLDHAAPGFGDSPPKKIACGAENVETRAELQCPRSLRLWLNPQSNESNALDC